MGIEDVWPSQMNNHIFAISPEYGYMWASDYRVAFVYTYLEDMYLFLFPMHIILYSIKDVIV